MWGPWHLFVFSFIVYDSYLLFIAFKGKTNICLRCKYRLYFGFSIPSSVNYEINALLCVLFKNEKGGSLEWMVIISEDFPK